MPPVRPIEALWAVILARKETKIVAGTLMFSHGYVMGGNNRYIFSGRYEQHGHTITGDLEAKNHPYQEHYRSFLGDDEIPRVEFKLERLFAPDFQYFGNGYLTNAINVPPAFSIALTWMESFPGYVLDEYTEADGRTGLLESIGPESHEKTSGPSFLSRLFSR